MTAFKTEYALDASALLAVMLNEPGHEKVRAVINRACIHSVNIAEVIGKLVREGVPRDEAEEMIEELSLSIAPVLSTADAALCGELLAKTRRQGLSLGDCVCLVFATSGGGIAVTADQQWRTMHGQRIGNSDIKVHLIR